ncbi:DUF6314 family protein [uncultured Tateyamaria sp.]|uniref:DUF6314 family protein n=1 Tax=uncultured Tateyamaria sp. TaxID=455651 RepID=UPI002620BCA7|nr:DUF6314 family protein [uncultured Tateyamaria sp.]
MTSPKPFMPTERQLGDFVGSWTLSRSITPAQGAPARFEGEARLSRTADGAAYAEAGVLYLEGAAPMKAERRYRWAEDLSVFFEDGRFFHKVPAMGGRTTHFCDPDTYTVDYDFSAWPVHTVRWTVKGPRKSYVMVSRYAPVAAP